jgi:GTP-binding protein HflX
MREMSRVSRERAILVAAILDAGENGDNLAELTALAESAGAIIAYRFQQKLRKINPATYIGKGKVDQLAQLVKRHDANLVVFDNNLSPGQIRELEEVVQARVLDRSELILDIFATRARTKQAKLQVSLAQLEYTYPRLTKMWSHLDTVAGAGGATAAGAVGAIGTRGTGEQQLEIDRRLVSKRITELRRELENIDRRKIREIEGRRRMFKVCLVGYTNAGKSTVLNKLTDAGVLVEDKLFATLDTRTKKWTPGGGIEILLSDTVGFVRNLPHQLVASFKATLEEAVNADLLLHVVDVSNSNTLKQIESVKQVLTEIGCKDKPTLEVFNKIDAVTKIDELEMLQTMFPDAINISAKTGMGIEALSEAVMATYKGIEIVVRITSSQSNGRLQSFLHANGQILSEKYHNDSVQIDTKIGRNQLPAIKRLGPESIEIISGQTE